MFELLDIFWFLSETKTLGTSQVEVEEYVTCSSNRTHIHKKAPGGSGGVASLIKNAIYQQYTVRKGSLEMDGVITLELKNKLCDTTFIIVGVYLPPDSSTHAQDPNMFFQRLVSLAYKVYNSDIVIFCGDFNARVGNKSDYVESVDELPQRVVLDTVTNDHGQSLINFCLLTNMCIVNGRVCPLNDSYTSVSHRGRAVVDYIITTHENIYDIDWFKVWSTGDLISEFNLVEEGGCKVSDHNMVICNVSLKRFNEVLTSDEVEHNVSECSEADQHVINNTESVNRPPKRYKKNPTRFLPN